MTVDMNSKKDDILAALDAAGLSYDPELTKRELLRLFDAAVEAEDDEIDAALDAAIQAESEPANAATDYLKIVNADAAVDDPTAELKREIAELRAQLAETKGDAEMPTEHTTRGEDARSSRASEENRFLEADRTIATHVQNSDSFINNYNSVIPSSGEWKFGWHLEGDPLPPFWEYVYYDELDDSVKHKFNPSRKGQLGNVVIDGGMIFAKIKREKYISDLQRYDEESFVNMKTMIEGSTGSVQDANSSVSPLTLDG